MKKRFFAVMTLTLLAVMFTFVIGSTASALVRGVGSPGDLVVDTADLLTDEEEAYLRSKLSEVGSRHNCDIVVLTIAERGDQTKEQIADDYYDYNGYSPNGMLLLYCVNPRGYHISTKGTCYEAVSYRDLDRFDAALVDKFINERFYSAFVDYANICDEVMSNYENPETVDKGSALGVTGAVAAGVGALTGAIGTGSMKSKLRSVEKKETAADYMKRDSLNIVDSNEIYLYSNVIRTPIQRYEEHRDSGGGAGGHISSSGATHGGGGRDF
ncbi:MAG: TPM domain-containing protein [Clostridia bacterium]|nr:TPM domain-containing protein [Clostridia bacterium]